MKKKTFKDRPTSISDSSHQNDKSAKRDYIKHTRPMSSVSSVSFQSIQLPEEFEKKPVIRVRNLTEHELEEKERSSIPSSSAQCRKHHRTLYKNWGITPFENLRTCDKSVGTQSKAVTEKIIKHKSSPNTSTDMHYSMTGKRVKGPEWKRSPKESNIADVPKAKIGKCPQNFEQLSKLSITRQKFFLTQNPRKTHCLTNPNLLESKTLPPQQEINLLTKLVKEAELLEKPKLKTSKNVICETIDMENPMNLDFQGLDYKKTYQNDEQDIENQRAYIKLSRHMERLRMRREIAHDVKQEELGECISVPAKYNVPDRDLDNRPYAVDFSDDNMILFRTEDKIKNREQIVAENGRRYERNKQLILRKMEREKKEESNRAIEEKRKVYEKPIEVSERNLTETTAAIRKEFDYDRHANPPVKPSIIREHKQYPRTYKEVKKLNKKFKVENRDKRDKALIKKEFYLQKLGVIKNYPETDLIISSDSPGSNDSITSEISTNDEDSIQVGRENNTFKIRGFQNKLGDNIRGKIHEHEKRMGLRSVKDCITREEWLKELTAKQEPVKVDIDRKSNKPKNPDDPEQKLQYGIPYTIPKIKASALSEYINEKKVDKYAEAAGNSLNIVKPQMRYKVKKFNIIGYLYGKKALQLKEIVDEKVYQETTYEYIQQRARKIKEKKELQKQNIINILNIDKPKKRKSFSTEQCEEYDTTSSDWVPEVEVDRVPKQSALIIGVSHSFINKGQMPAPKLRETTLRRHPRKPRDYLNERVPSEQFNTKVTEANIPYMNKLEPDKKVYENVRLKKTEYSAFTETRRHHDHSQPTQFKEVNVQYQPIVSEPKILPSMGNKNKVAAEADQNKKYKENVNRDFTLPTTNIKEMIAESKVRRAEKKKAELMELENKHETHDAFHTRLVENLQAEKYPGRRQYLQLLKEMVGDIVIHTEIDPERETKIKAICNELEDDLKSIESCMSSLESSECTNFTDDSGSFLIVHGETKLPLDYIRKPLVPFEELQHSRFYFKPIDYKAERNNPYRTMPFSGQKQNQQEIVTPEDNIYTANTRLKKNLRVRLEVPTIDVTQTLIGYKHHQYYPHVATDVDENFIKDINRYTICRKFNFKTSSFIIKEALRLKIESVVIREFIVRNEITNTLNQKFLSKMEKIKCLYEKLFDEWERKQFNETAEIVYQVQGIYERTDTLKREWHLLERKLMIMNLDIIFIEGKWIRLITFQNFVYLLPDKDWRYENDWIHRISKPGEPVELENFDVSIQNRNTANIRVREKDDANAVKEYYENVYKPKNNPILLPYKDNHELLEGIQNLKKMTFLSLLELHLNMSISYDLQSQVNKLKEWCDIELKAKVQQVNRKCARKYFMKSRADDLRSRVMNSINKNIVQSFSNERAIKKKVYVEHAWQHIVDIKVFDKKRGTGTAISTNQMVAMIVDTILDLMAKVDEFPPELASKTEHDYRIRFAKRKKTSRDAYHFENRLQSQIKALHKSFEPLPPRPRKLIKYKLKKKIKEPPSAAITEKVITERERFLMRAFNSNESFESFCSEGFTIVQNINAELVTPFYFDYFLTLHGYTPNYNFKTQVELRDGPELKRLKISSVIPELKQKMSAWEANRLKTIEDNIIRYHNIYDNVYY